MKTLNNQEHLRRVFVALAANLFVPIHVFMYGK
jgi:hypothetical protein